jgi:hypothetical protein
VQERRYERVGSSVVHIHLFDVVDRLHTQDKCISQICKFSVLVFYTNSCEVLCELTEHRIMRESACSHSGGCIAPKLKVDLVSATAVDRWAHRPKYEEKSLKGWEATLPTCVLSPNKVRQSTLGRIMREIKNQMKQLEMAFNSQFSFSTNISVQENLVQSGLYLLRRRTKKSVFGGPPKERTEREFPK